MMDVPADIVVTGRNVIVSLHYRSYIADKLAHLEHFSRHIIRYDVELNHEQNPRQSKSSQRVTITSRGKGSSVRAEAHGADAHAVLDAAVGRLEGQLRRNHDRHQVHHYRHQRMSVGPGRA
ncbi:ribosome-associated translation inhibitor RaiA [Pseudonocardia sp.]|jgi:ribosomal subunit interface protein|uniref:ribosome hibernation-promoting factor, HPF/YfiA family n=1 Tax=Pseudonocardia sp. TaxID=60912 RepID=UPI0031FD308E